MLTLFLSSHLTASFDYNNWVTPSSPTLPRALCCSAVGYDSINNTIWIVGGDDSSRQAKTSLISYDIDSGLFTDYGTTALPSSIYGQRQFYTQIGDILYIVYGGTLSTFNVNTAQLTVSDDPNLL
eukprot:765849_1